MSRREGSELRIERTMFEGREGEDGKNVDKGREARQAYFIFRRQGGEGLDCLCLWEWTHKSYMETVGQQAWTHNAQQCNFSIG